MKQIADWLFGSNGFMPHGHCYLWTPGIVWLHVVSDAFIALAYYSIPLTLFWFLRQRRDLDFRMLFACFGAFITACGTTHLLEIWNVWHANYLVSGLVKALTAAVSVPTAVLLARIMPQALTLQSPSVLQAANAALAGEVEDRRRAERELRELNAGLETRVRERTESLEVANLQLRQTISEMETAREKAAWLASFPEQNPNPISELDLRAGKVTYANPSARARFSSVEIDGFQHPWHEGVTEMPWAQEGTERQVITRPLQMNEAWYWQTISFDPVDRRIRVYGNDVTAQWRADAERLASMREVMDLKAALDEHAIVAITDPQGRINYVNDKFCAISKYAREELVGQDHRIINSGYHPKEFIRNLWMTITHGRVWHGEIKNRAKDGSYYWVATTIVPFLDEQKKPRQYVAIRADITARKEAEEVQTRFAALVASSDDAIVGKTPEGIVTAWNPGAEKTFGYSAEEMIGQSIRALIPSERPHEEDEILARLARGEKIPQFETVRVCKDGRRIDVSVTVSPIMSADGRIVGASTIARDITAQKRVQDEVHRLNAELENRVLERTAQLEAANGELEAFSYSVSHDLRAPLRAVDGFSQAVIEDFGSLLPEQGRRYLQTIRGGAQRMGALIDDLLTFSRLGRHPVTKQTVDAAWQVRETLEELEEEHAGRQIDIRLGELPACEGDPALLKHVWTNLLANAFKYTKKRERAVIEIASMPEGELVVYFVRDNGVGFDMRHAGKLFGVFQRLHRQEEFEGTGVGLAIVHRIVHRHGGRVWADATLDRGATFYFTLKEEPLK